MPTRRLTILLAAATLFSAGCHAQFPTVPAVGPTVAVPNQPLPVAVARNLEVLLRQKAQLPPGSTINIGTPTASELPGYVSVAVTFTNEGNTSRPNLFLISADGKFAAQFNKFDISADPRALVSADNRPARGGPPTAPVLIVGFDDLECPFCARLHSTIFPAIQQRYGDKVRIVYKDFPLGADLHPWALHAAVDVNCLAAQSPTGYWNEVDYIHAHAGEIGDAPADPAKPNAKPERSLPNAVAQLDKITREQGQFQHVDMAQLDACVAKQDPATVDAMKKLGTALQVDSTPTLFINGDKVDGAVPIDFIFNIIDNALRAENITPPPPYIAPKPPTATVAKPSGN